MAEDENGILQNSMPAVQAGLAVLSLAHPAAAAIAAVFTMPLAYQAVVSTTLERERMSILLNETYGAAIALGNEVEKLKSAMGEDLLSKALAASRHKPGAERITDIARVLAKFNGSENSYIESADFIATIDSLTEAEWTILKAAYELYPRKETIGLPREPNVSQLPHILQWTELHQRFPAMTPLEINFVFSSIERTGLLMKEHGFVSDGGDVFSFTPNLKRLINSIELIPKES